MSVVQEALDELINAGPWNVPLHKGITDTEAAVMVGEDRGFARFPALFKQMAESWPLKGRMPEPTYAPPET